MLLLIRTIRTFALDLIKDEIASAEADNRTTLLYKWLPTAKNYPRLAKAISNHLGISIKEYRQMLSAKRAELRIVERLMSDGKWDEINYSELPSYAAKNYRNAFHTQDGERYRQYLEDLTKPEKAKEVKINAGVLYPHDLVHSYENYLFEADQTIEAQWKALPDYLATQKETLCH